MEEREKKSPQPSPIAYNPKKATPKILGNFKQQTQRITFIEEAKAQGMSTPGHAFTNFKEERVKARSKAARIFKELKKVDPRFAKLEKVDGPDPGSY